MYNGKATVEKSLVVLQKLRWAVWASNYTPGHIAKHMCTQNLCMNIHSGVIHDSRQQAQPKCIATNDWESWSWHIHIMGHYLDRKGNGKQVQYSVDETWQVLEVTEARQDRMVHHSACAVNPRITSARPSRATEAKARLGNMESVCFRIKSERVLGL